MWALLSWYLRRSLWIAGRSSRLEWWIIEALVVAAYAGWDSANGLLFKLGIADWPTRFAVLLALFAPVFWLNVASSVRRLHDRNRSGWWVVLYAVPLLGQLWQFIECGILPPRDAGNRFDPAPELSPATVQRVSPTRELKTAGLFVAVLVAAFIVTAFLTARVHIIEVGTNESPPVFQKP